MTLGMNAPEDQQPLTPTSFDEAISILSGSIPNYEARPEQALLAHAIESALDDDATLIGQGGCGVGKSFAALLPAIVSGRRVVYSTATKALQEQIATKDLPFLAEHFPVTFAILKGRSNYLCEARLQEMDDSPERADILASITDEDGNRVGTGERDTLPPIDNTTWSKLTISSDECPGKRQCPYGQVCFAEKAKDAARAAQIVVVNHALLAVDSMVRSVSDGFVSMLDEYECLIVDEAHELEDYVCSALATSFRASSVAAYAVEFRNLGRMLRLDGFEEIASDLNAAAGRLFDVLPTGRLRQKDILSEYGEPLDQLMAAYAAASDRLRSQDVLDALPTGVTRSKESTRRDRLVRRAGNSIEALTRCLLNSDAELVRMVSEEFRRGVTVPVLTITPVTVGDWLKENLWSYVSPILISATLLVDGSSSFISGRLGISQHRVVDAGTPFDYQRQSLLFVPSIPEPSGRTLADWEGKVLTEIERLVGASRGRALLLFTSRRNLDRAWTALSPQIPYPCMKQGVGTNAELMARFKNETDSVLFATRSFFTGVDVQGESLSLVVIDKLPFPVPTDPVFEARADVIKRRGDSDFSELTIPTMTLPLQQAAGRLIRTKEDRGVVAILDPRMMTKGYGQSIVRSLPPMRQTRDFRDVVDFFAEREVSA